VRRPIGVLVTAALAATLIPGIARASFDAMTAPALDLRAQLMLRLFGETSDSRASLAASYGDRSSESPLRELALQVGPRHHTTAFFASDSAPAGINVDLAQAARGSALQSGVRFSAPLQPPANAAPAPRYDVANASPAATFTAGEYEPVAPAPLISPQPGTFSFGPLPRGASFAVPENASLAFGAGSALPGAATSSVIVPSAVRIGRLQVQTRMGSASTNAPQLSLNDNGYDAGANFNVRAGARNVNVDVSSGYERLTRNDTSAISAPAVGTTSSWQLPGDDLPLVIPNYADLSKISVGAAVAVPVVSGLTLNLNYAADRMFGGYGLPGLANLDTTGNSYGGKLTFAIPHSSSTLSISASQLRYQDGVLPANLFSQTREDVNFTVKF
jgi:hypothetical protein